MKVGLNLLLLKNVIELLEKELPRKKDKIGCSFVSQLILLCINTMIFVNYH